MAFKSGSGTIQRFFAITPQTLELSFTGNTSSAETANFNSNVSTSATHVLCDIFVTRSTVDHQNYVFGRSGQVGNHKNWVDARGQQPSGQFSNMGADIIIITSNGESDGYGDNYGLWYSSQMSPQVVVLFTGIILVIVEVMDISLLNIEDITNQKVISGRFNN